MSGANEIVGDLIVVGQKAAASYAKVETKTIQRWTRAGMWTASDGRNKIYLKPLLDYFHDSTKSPANPTRDKRENAEADFKHTRAQLAAMELAEKQGQLIDREKVEKESVMKIRAIRSAITGMNKAVTAIACPRCRAKVNAASQNHYEKMCKRFAQQT